jgi:hypothetical protein
VADARRFARSPAFAGIRLGLARFAGRGGLAWRAVAAQPQHFYLRFFAAGTRALWRRHRPQPVRTADQPVLGRGQYPAIFMGDGAGKIVVAKRRIVAIVGLLFWGLFRLLRAVIAVTARDAVPYALRSRLGWAMTSLAVLLAVANQAGASFTWPLVAKPVIPSYWRQVQLLAAAFSPQHQAALLPATTAVDTAMAAKSANTLGALGGRDVYLIMLESVGAITYDDAHAVRTYARAVSVLPPILRPVAGMSSPLFSVRQPSLAARTWRNWACFRGST